MSSRSPSLLSVLSSPRVWLMLALGFASGLPLYLTGSTLAAWMTNEGVSLKTIGIFGLVGTPYVFKFAWAPLMDRYVPPFLGRRRGWLVVTQVLLALTLVAMGQVNPRTDALAMACLAVLVAFLSASQDIAADAYRTDLLSEEERAFGVSVFTLGYRVGMVIAMSVALILSDVIGWKYTYPVMGLFLAVGVVAAVLGPEPTASRPPRTLPEAVVKPFVEYLKRGWPAVLALVFIVAFRVGDAVAFRMTTPFVLKLGFTNTELGLISKLPGMLGSIGGALVGGLLITKLGMRRGLFLFGSAQALTNLLYVALAARGKDPFFLAFTVGADNFCGGMGSAAITVFITALCNKNFSATQYALLSSLSAVPMQLLGAFSGYLAEALGWSSFYVATTLAMTPALVLLALMPRDMGQPPQPQAATEQATPPTVAPEAAAELASAAKKGAG
ncbi:AmpG family muropeptide MFS transporter [Hyalangium rubrum]|uniref:AmpG family muropeptide MFS transporter n=1 Tax=Hyalangium rubrum TaxID=3103134 RepID=A0ABU5H3H1_9BACT|nr:AmpG family muropeptide MFS transporter [Hyalangium sp. s54d21]MDY7227337.1 AmpG family muropeptide MFS transporter [Hyalangium sp. s54d21]